MSSIAHSAGRLAARLAAVLVAGYVLLASAAAFAQPAPYGPDGSPAPSPLPPSSVPRHVVEVGSPIWQFVVVAVLAAVAALVIDHALNRRRLVRGTGHTFA